MLCVVNMCDRLWAFPLEKLEWSLVTKAFFLKVVLYCVLFTVCMSVITRNITLPKGRFELSCNTMVK